MSPTYTTLERDLVSLAGLTQEERRFLGNLAQQAKAGVSFLDFENLYSDADSAAWTNARRLGVSMQDAPVYKICQDMAKRLGIRQGFLVREEVVARYAAKSPVEELTTGEAARLAGCTDEAVRKAIRTGRLRARRVGRFSLVREEDARAFASGRKQGGRSP